MNGHQFHAKNVEAKMNSLILAINDANEYAMQASDGQMPLSGWAESVIMVKRLCNIIRRKTLEALLRQLPEEDAEQLSDIFKGAS